MVIQEECNNITILRYINLRSQDPLDKDHRGVKLKKKGGDSQTLPPRKREECFYKEE